MISIRRLANKAGVSYDKINNIIRGHTGLVARFKPEESQRILAALEDARAEVKSIKNIILMKTK